MTAIRHPNRLWIVAIFLAWCLDLLFWKQAAGVSFPLWVGLSLAGIFICAFWEQKKPSWPSYLLAAVALGLALTNTLRAEPFSRSFTALLSLVCMGLLAATFLTGNWIYYRIGDLIIAAFKLVAAGVARGAGKLGEKPSAAPSPAAAGALATNPATPTDEKTVEKPAVKPANGFVKTVKTILPILRGLILALPVLAVLSALLASADPIFNDQLRSLLSAFDLAKLPEYLFRLFYILILGYAFAGEMLHALQPDPIEARPNPQEAWKTRLLGITECSIVLGSVVALFAFFVVLQMQYLFGGQANITATRYTFADYARRGFFELVWVALLSLALYVVLSAITRREAPAQRRTFSVLAVLLMLLVLVILDSAWLRLQLYENAYGFTRLRIYTHIFIPWLALLLLAAMLLEVFQRAGHFGLALILFSMGFGLTFTGLNVDGLITQLNLSRARSNAELDVSHLAGLSSDAVPALAQAFNNPQENPEVREQAGAALACHWAATYGVGMPEEGGYNHKWRYQPDWRGYNFSDAYAAQTLAGLDLSSYLQKGERGWEVFLKGNQVDCYQSYD
jgi:hypothetical protein